MAIVFTTALDVEAARARFDAVFVLPRGTADRDGFYAAVRATLPLDPPVMSSHPDALADSLWEGLHALAAQRIAIVWPGAGALAEAAPDDFALLVDVLAGVADDLADAAATVGAPKQVTVLVERDPGAVHVAWGELSAIEPTEDELAAVAERLARAYNDPRNATLLGHTDELDAGDVIDHYADSAEDGARQFLLYADGELAGDGDLRGIDGGTAEFAFLIGEPGAQGKGLGTRFAIMIHAFGFATLGLHTIYASVAPANTASLRVFEKLGYRADDSPRARHYADEPGDVTLSIDRASFEARHAAALAAIAIKPRAG